MGAGPRGGDEGEDSPGVVDSSYFGTSASGGKMIPGEIKSTSAQDDPGATVKQTSDEDVDVVYDYASFGTRSEDSFESFERRGSVESAQSIGRDSTGGPIVAPGVRLAARNPPGRAAQESTSTSTPTNRGLCAALEVVFGHPHLVATMMAFVGDFAFLGQVAPLVCKKWRQGICRNNYPLWKWYARWVPRGRGIDRRLLREFLAGVGVPPKKRSGVRDNGSSFGRVLIANGADLLSEERVQENKISSGMNIVESDVGRRTTGAAAPDDRDRLEQRLITLLSFGPGVADSAELSARLAALEPPFIPGSDHEPAATSTHESNGAGTSVCGEENDRTAVRRGKMPAPYRDSPCTEKSSRGQESTNLQKLLKKKLPTLYRALRLEHGLLEPFARLTRVFQISLCAADLRLFKHFFAEGVAPELFFCLWAQSLFTDCPLFSRRNSPKSSVSAAPDVSAATGTGGRGQPTSGLCSNVTDLFATLWDVILVEKSPKTLVRFAVAYCAELEDPLRRRSGDRAVALLLDGVDGGGDVEELLRGSDGGYEALWNRAMGLKVTRELLRSEVV